MKKLIILALFFIVAKFSFGQFPLTQNIGSGSALVRVPANGGFQASLINRNFSDTTAANLTPITYYSGAQIYTTSDSSFWVRNWLSNKWQKIAVGGGGSDTVIVNGDFWGVHGNEFIGADLAEPSIGVVSSPGSAFGMWFLANGVRSLYFPPNGLSLLNDTTNTKVMTFNPTTKNWGYANWVGGGGSAGWNLTGNAGTDTALNFVGTTDDEPLRIKVNNQQSGLILNNSPWNTYFGYTAGSANTSGAINVGIGWGALRDNITGSSNVAIGLAAIQNATNSNENVAIGYGALANIANHRNVAVGASAMTNSRDADQNTSVGNYSMLANRQGDYVNAFGSSALRGNVDGSNNVGIGNISLTQNTTAIQSISVTAGGTGYTTATVVISAPIVASDPNNNSLQATATATLSGGAVVSITITEPGKGYSSFSPPTATISGDGSGATLSVTLTSGEYNTGVGVSSLVANRTGKYNSAIGYGAGGSIDTGSYNLFLGSFAGNHVSQKVDVRSSIAIGPNAYTTANNQFVISDSITSYKFPNISSGAGTKALRYDPATDLITIGDTSTATTSLPISSLTAATGTNSIENADYAQTWNWSGLTNHQGLYLLSNGTAASGNNQQLLTVQLAGANANSTQTTKAARFLNGHTGTSSTNIAAEFSATLGTNNYAIIVPASSGSVGIGTSTPSKVFHTVGTVRMESLGTASTDTTTYKPVGINSSGDIIPMTYWPGGGGSGLTVGTTTVGSANSRAILYSNTGILKDSSIFVFNPGGELQVGSASDAGGYRLQVTGKTYGTDTAFFTSHARIAGIDIGVYGGSVGFQNNYANTSRPDLYFRTFNGSSTNGNIYFESGAFKVQMMANDASKNQLQVVYGGNTGYFNVGSHTSIYSSSGQELQLGSNGTQNQVTIASGRVGINATSPAASAQLEVASTTKGFLPPRMTATQAEAISSPAEGLLIYSTNGTGTTITSKGWWGYDGSTWVKLN